jgi:hypothetical protein
MFRDKATKKIDVLFEFYHDFTKLWLINNSSLYSRRVTWFFFAFRWKKNSRWSDIMISWDDEMRWWNSEPRTSRRTFLSRRNLFDQMIWSSDLIDWFLFHHIIIQFFMHERLDLESHFLIWDDSYRQFLHQYVDFESSRSTIIQSRWFIQVEMISFISTEFRDLREVKEFEDEYAILMRLDRSENEARRHFDQKKRVSWRSKISTLREISMNHEMKDQ